MMLSAASLSLAQIFSPAFRSVLIKSTAFALLAVIVLGIVVQRVLAYGVQHGGTWIEATFSSLGRGVVGALELALTIIGTLGIFVAMVFLMPAATSLVAGVFADEVASQVERKHYPADRPGVPLSVARGLLEGGRAALLSVLIYLCAVPFLLVAGLGVALFFVATAFLLSREYFHLAAMRHRSPAEAKAMRKRHAGAVFRAGLLIAAFVSIPILNLFTPLFATAFMVHIHKRLSESEAPAISSS